MTPKIGLLIILICFLLWALLTYNSLVRFRSMIIESWQLLVDTLNQRADKLKSLISFLSLDEQTHLKNLLIDRIEVISSVKKLAEFEKDINQIIANNQSLKNQLQDIEIKLEQQRFNYNSIVKEYNYRVTILPANFIAQIFRFYTQPMFVDINIEISKEQ